MTYRSPSSGRAYPSGVFFIGFTIFSVHAQGVWERRANYPISATEVSAAEIEGKIYAACGLTAEGPTNGLFVYDPLRDAWTAGARAPVAGDHCNVAAANGKLYLLGAIRIGSAFVDGNTYEYDPRRDRWSSVARMPTPRGASGVASDGRRIYVAGGTVANAFEVFDSQTNEWTRLPNMPTGRDHLTAQFTGGKFYALAGRNSRDVATVEEFDPAANTWRARRSAPTARGGVASAVVDGKIYVMGGEGASGTPQNTFRQNEEYDPVADSWRALPDMPTPRHGLYAAAVGRAIFTPSGGPIAGATYSNVNEAYIVAPASPPSFDSGPVNAASYSSELGEGVLVTWFGRSFAPAAQVSTGAATQLLGTRVTLNGAALPLLAVAPGQVSFRLPAAGELRLISAGVESAAFRVASVAAASPGIFSLSQDGKGQGAILVAGTGLLARLTRDAFSTPARLNGVVEIYCTGLGATDRGADGLERTRVSVTAEVDGRNAEVLYSGLAPGLFGVYQVNARVPAETRVGNAVEVRLRAAGAVSNVVTMGVTD
ncbi:MAG: hypothetical protein FJW32_08105 [Acidobacteria bacterium]|nr:hypothetical protein [Acidobacteriota bacterium]